jgi:arylsulfatase A-like enzyme
MASKNRFTTGLGKFLGKTGKSNAIFFPAALLVVMIMLISGFAFEAEENEKQKPLNVLFIAVDDLRPELGCYGNNQIISPNIDHLAQEGMLFDRAYCQQAVCSPSRTSLLTGLRPDSTQIFDLQTHFRTNLPDVVTLPQYFKQQGYHTEWWGKIFHAALLDPISWSKQGERFEPEDNWRAYASPENIQIAAAHNGSGPSFENIEVPDNTYPDGKIADSAVEALSRLKNQDEPFFLAVGFYKPHLPFNAPKKYWDLYTEAEIELPDHRSPPKNVPDFALTNWGELRNYTDIPKEGDLTDEKTIQLIHGYRASVSYSDAQVGRLLQALKKNGLDKNTIVILWGDHGWKLGEYGDWAKHTNFEIDARVPLIVRVPDMLGKGEKTDALVELVDLYPTLCELTGLPIPKQLQGTSFVPLLKDANIPWKKAAFSQYPRGKLMGYSMRTERYRFTRWQKSGEAEEVEALELYDLQEDPDALVNIADMPENRQIITELSEQMNEARMGKN